MSKSKFILVSLLLLYILTGAFVLNAQTISYLPYNAAPDLSKHGGEYNKIGKDNGDVLYLPKVAFGTDLTGFFRDTTGAYRDRTEREIKDVLSCAITQGHRVFDTAESYKTASILAEAIKESKIPREKFFIIYKVSWAHCYSFEYMEPAYIEFDGYIDIVMIHFASYYHGLNEKCLEYLKKEVGSRIGFFGLSNIRKDEFPAYKDFPKVSFVQNQFNPLREDLDVRQYCKSEDIVYMGYSILGGGTGRCGSYYDFDKYLRPPLEVLASEYKHATGDTVTPEEILYGWALSQIDMVITRSSKPERIEQNKEGRLRKFSEDIPRFTRGYRLVFDHLRSLYYSDQEIERIRKENDPIAIQYFEFLNSQKITNDRETEIGRKINVKTEFETFQKIPPEKKRYIKKVTDCSAMLSDKYRPSGDIIFEFPLSYVLERINTNDDILDRGMAVLYKLEEMKHKGITIEKSIDTYWQYFLTGLYDYLYCGGIQPRKALNSLEKALELTM